MTDFLPIKIAILTVSDSRTLATDTSGSYLVQAAESLGHHIADRRIHRDDLYEIRAIVAQWIADPNIDAILSTGGTGLTGRDITPEAITPLLDKQIDGFGELFRYLSLKDVSTSTVQSRCVGGVANGTLIFAMPGSTGACKTGWEGILVHQLDSRTRPCNFIQLLPRLKET